MSRPITDDMIHKAKAVLEDHLGGFVSIPTVRAALESALAEPAGAFEALEFALRDDPDPSSMYRAVKRSY